MDHIRVTFQTSAPAQSHMVMAGLIDVGFDGFEESGDNLIAYIGLPHYNKENVDSIAKQYVLEYDMEIIPAQNWNALWEGNFQPVVIEGFCTIRASFHVLDVATEHEILITPKMSFGTGHHATTQLMMLQMRGIDFNAKTVLDFGTGTGILAILAEKLGAANILAIDNDEWSYTNAKENVLRNNCTCITVTQDTLIDDGQTYDVVLANINRHILLENMAQLYSHVMPDGKIIMSGLMHADEEVIVTAAVGAGFILDDVRKLGDWLLVAFGRPI